MEYVQSILGIHRHGGRVERHHRPQRHHLVSHRSLRVGDYGKDARPLEVIGLNDGIPAAFRTASQDTELPLPQDHTVHHLKLRRGRNDVIFTGTGVDRGRDIVTAYLIDLKQRGQVKPQRRPSSGLQGEGPRLFQICGTGDTHARDVLNAESQPIRTIAQPQWPSGEISNSQNDLTLLTGEKLVLIKLQFHIHLSVDVHDQQEQAEPRR